MAAGQYTITIGSSQGGTVHASASKATAGTKIFLSVTPNTGYTFNKYTTSPASLTITNNSFIMPAANVTITPVFNHPSYTITTGVSPSGSGTLSASSASAYAGDTIYLTKGASEGYTFSSYMSNVVITNNSFTMPASNVSITANFVLTDYTISTSSSPAAGGTVTASKATGNMGDTITLTVAPSTGYQLSSWSATTGVTITNNSFTMPAKNVSITANFTKISYTITRKTVPEGVGTITTRVGNTYVDSATYGDYVIYTKSINAGYLFKEWLVDADNYPLQDYFVMPAHNVTLRAVCYSRSTVTVNTSSCTGGSNIVMYIASEDSTYKHRYQLSFGSGMATAQTDVAAGTGVVTISIPIEWCNYCTNSTSKSGGTLTLWTYKSDNTPIGSYTLTGLTFYVPGTIQPSVTDVSTSILRTIGQKIYADVGNYYVQNHCGVRVTGNASGSYGSSITSMTVSVLGYTGSDYNGSNTGSSGIVFNSGLLTAAGTQRVRVTATDSRGRTASRDATFTVTTYSPPTGSIRVWRVDQEGETDPTGLYGKYTITASCAAIGTNAITRKRISTVILGQTYAEDVSSNTGDILPSSRKQFQTETEYAIVLQLTDTLGDTTTITTIMQTARYIIYASADGYQIGFQKAANKAIPSGKSGTIEFSGLYEIYIGDLTLADYIRNVVNNM